MSSKPYNNIFIVQLSNREVEYGIDGGSAESSFSSIISGYNEATQKPHKILEGKEDRMIHINKPGHELERKNVGTMNTCTGCKMQIFGLHNACKNASCTFKFKLHEECMCPRKTTRNRFFPGLTFAFSAVHNTNKKHTNIFCNACGLEVNGYYYHSLDGMNNLHPCCINLPMETTCGESVAEMVLQQETTFECGSCGKRSVKVGKHSTDKIWSYVAKSENYCLHIGCMIKEFSNPSMGSLISCNMTSKGGKGKMDLQIAWHNGALACKNKLKIIPKYARIVFGAIIAALLGDATSLFVNTAIALRSSSK